jgi:hypothetical protein
LTPDPVPGESPINLATMRNELLDRPGITATAWSADGRHFATLADALRWAQT